MPVHLDVVADAAIMSSDAMLRGFDLAPSIRF